MLAILLLNDRHNVSNKNKDKPATVVPLILL